MSGCEAHDAEAFSRKLSRRVGKGYAAKRRRLGVPGGNRPPLGYRRERDDPGSPRSPQRLVIDPDKAPVVLRAFEMSASGLTDREVATALGLKLMHVREILKNPVYVDTLRTGDTSGGPVLISRSLWDQASVVRSRYARRNRGPVSQRAYPLATLLVCASCGRRLTGHVGRYRHVDACPAFKAARPKETPWKSPGDGRVRGESYKAQVFDDLFPQILEHVQVGAMTLTQVVGGLSTSPDTAFALARIGRERELATNRVRNPVSATPRVTRYPRIRPLSAAVPYERSAQQAHGARSSRPAAKRPRTHVRPSLLARLAHSRAQPTPIGPPANAVRVQKVHAQIGRRTIAISRRTGGEIDIVGEVQAGQRPGRVGTWLPQDDRPLHLAGVR